MCLGGESSGRLDGRKSRREGFGKQTRGFVVSRRNSVRRLPALREFMDGSFLSLSIWSGRTHPAGAQKKRNLQREDFDVTLCPYIYTVECTPRKISFFPPYGNEQAFLSSRAYSMSAYAYVVHFPLFLPIFLPRSDAWTFQQFPSYFPR